MVCTHCGKEVEPEDAFCPSCGQRLREVPETLLFSFGPFGVEACDGPYSIWKWHRRNSFVVELTNTRLCLLANTGFGVLTIPAMRYPWGVRLPLEVPYASIVSVEVHRHPSPIALMDILEFQYREGGAVAAKSIASYKANIQRACEIIRRYTG